VIRVAFWYDRPQEYSGGLNYFRNLMYALSRVSAPEISPYVFFGTRVDKKTIREFHQLATVVTTRLLDRMSFAWIIQRVLFKYLGSLILIKLIVRRHGIEVVSHGEHVYGKVRPFLVVRWIPDFQYLHLPELFPRSYVAQQSSRIRTMVQQSDALVLSSRDALEDFQRIAGSNVTAPVTVLPFVSQPTIASADESPAVRRSRLKERYGVEGQFFYLPNQFWSHKNHTVVFEAVRLAKVQGSDITLVCTGNLKDYRSGDDSYANQMAGFIAAHRLESNISILGSIDYSDVLQLMDDCIAVINPSRFEGWSSTVEEAKSMGKRLILSDIPVHREQAPARATYFRPDDVTELARVLIENWKNPVDADMNGDRRRAREALEHRTLEFARGYTKVILDLCRTHRCS
jgi:glycosyltransferase involved in cell wall biosynthesis